MPAMGEHEQAGDAGGGEQFEQQPAGRDQFELAPVAQAQLRGDRPVAGLLRTLAPERAHVAQAPREILAEPEQPRHVGHVLPAYRRLFAAVGARGEQP